MKMKISCFMCFIFSVVYTCAQDEIEHGVKLPCDSNAIRKHFTVLDSELSMISSVDWDSDFMCWDMKLQSDLFPKNYTISYIRRKPFSPGLLPLLQKLPQIKKIINRSYLSKYISKHDSSTLEIHFVNTKGLSREARRGLNEDFKDLQIEQTLPKLNGAVLVFTDEGNDNWHGWLVLKNGSALLWYYKGDKVLDITGKIKAIKAGSYNYSFQIISASGEIITN